MPVEPKKRMCRANVARNSTTLVTSKRIAAKKRQPYPLPSLPLPPALETAVSVTVLPLPTVGNGRGLTWTVDDRPAEQLQKGKRITMRTDTQTSGIGRLSAISDLRRHWVTFTVAGATQPFNLRVPIPWASLEDLESYTHQHHYFDLPNLPPPHRFYADRPAFLDDKENPYEFDINEDDIPSLTNRLDSITNV
ncbi:uncharacterized protein C8Q71DRAFT_855094 [Rhodofomes roseus]|uniref:Uncharacterized protein n=1 Tax=Rhodofomes roseus TaxID=34475 RepID=A0ABQ8KNL2_9APHY|nr:uncharacterized protein C8Q71DRAFT_855094 [Rhodofomes roseus]KAH9839783.1 hypothetical protein C8Q71DRAFT_855094 [Rhodofomes roseus]